MKKKRIVLKMKSGDDVSANVELDSVYYRFLEDLKDPLVKQNEFLLVDYNEEMKIGLCVKKGDIESFVFSADSELWDKNVCEDTGVDIMEIFAGIGKKEEKAHDEDCDCNCGCDCNCENEENKVKVDEKNPFLYSLSGIIGWSRLGSGGSGNH